MPKFAEIGADGVCFAVNEIIGITPSQEYLDNPSIIPIPEDLEAMGLKWNGTAWEEGPNIAPAASPTNAEIQENQLIIMAALVDIYEKLSGGAS